MSIKFTFAPEITDEVILQAFEGTSFGRTDFREFLGYSVLQKACGWHCGFTITNIMIGLKLITPEHHRVTKLGRMFLSDCYDDPLRKPQPVSQRYKLPDGWNLVPIEPTEDMIVDGFESEPDESFSEAKVWEEYDTMSGCQQAAHRAMLCWKAMLAAAPEPE